MDLERVVEMRSFRCNLTEDVVDPSTSDGQLGGVRYYVSDNE